MLQCLLFTTGRVGRFINLFNHLYQGLTFTEGSLIKSDLIKSYKKKTFLFFFILSYVFSILVLLHVAWRGNFKGPVCRF